MAPPALFPRVRHVLAALIASAAVLIPASVASAATFPVIESFQNTTAPGWNLGGAATLTAPADGQGNGWLRLTPATTNQSGYASYDSAFASSDGVLVDFEYAQWGGTGADGITFFLYDGATTAQQFGIGVFGGGLGYTACAADNKPGLKNAYVGIGFDQFGNFAGQAGCSTNSGPLTPNTLTVRGSASKNYAIMKSTAVPKGIAGNRSATRKVRVALTPSGLLTVTIRFPDGTTQTPIENLQLDTPPATLKLGYAAATGGSTNYHEIRTSGTVKPTDLRTTITDGATGATRVGPRTWTATVKNHGPNPTAGETVKASTGAQSLTGVTWTCTATAGASCGPTASGTGLPSVTAGAMPVNGVLTYAITGTPASATDFAELSLEALPTGDTGDLTPADNTATDTTTLTPVFDGAPTVALASNGTATVTPQIVRGGQTSSTYEWQRCDAAGNNCTVIAGQTATTYATSTADRGRTVRATQVTTNAAGTASRTSAAVASVPGTSFDSAPTGARNAATASLTFSSTAPGATFQCAVDGPAYSACASPLNLTGLAQGSHSVRVRAVSVAGVVDPAPVVATWTVDTTAPTTTVGSGPAGGITKSRDVTLTFGGLDTGGTGVDAYECKLDGGAWTACTSPKTFSNLNDGDHTVSVRAVDQAGNPDPTPPSLSFKVDATAPTTTITGKPNAFAGAGNGAFTFTSSDGTGSGVAGAECKLDNDAWAACTSPQSVSGLADGAHTMLIRATDQLGSVESPVARYEWTVDTAAPTTTLTIAPSGLTTATSATFAFGGTDAGGSGVGSYECKLDDGDWAACTNPKSYSDLPDGLRTVSIRALDRAGNPDPTPRTASWTIDSTPPTTVLTAGPDWTTTATTAEFQFFGTDARSGVPGSGVAGYECKLDYDNWRECEPPKVYTGLAVGDHVFRVRSTDNAGLADVTYSSLEWTITGPGTPTDPTDPTDPTTPTTPVDPTDPTTPTTPVDPTDPTTPTTPVDPTDPTTPTTPVDPTDPTTPTTPVDPTDPTTPTTPVDPTDPTTPTTPVDPTDPTTPTTPVDPTDPTTPTTPVDPTDPTTPTTPVDPTDPTTPTTPVDPTDPTTPTTPVDPTDPTTPTTPVDPTDPTTPTTPTGPTTPVGPTTPTGPVTPSNPTTPTTPNPVPSDPDPVPASNPTYNETAPTTTPSGPTVVSQPPAVSDDPTATFTFDPKPGSTVMCSVDGSKPVDCTKGLTLNELLAGLHKVTAVTIDANGNASAPVTYSWTVRGEKITLTTRIAKKGIVVKGKAAAICKVSGDTLRVCNVKLYARVGKKVVSIGAGRRAIKGTGKATLGVKIKLNKVGMRVIKGKTKGVKVSIRTKALPAKSAAISSTAKAKIKVGKAK